MNSPLERLRNACKFVLAVLVLPAALRAGEGDNVLAYYLSKAPLVVSGEVVRAGVGLSKRGSQRERYRISLKVKRVLKGKVDGHEIEALCVQFVPNPYERPAFLRANAQVILFLRPPIEGRGEVSGWLGVDPWFAVQPATESLERALARLAAASASEPEPEPVGVDESGDMTLSYYKSKASLVVSGEITELSPAAYADDSTCTRSLHVKVGRIIRGGVQGDVIEAKVVRFEDESSEPPFLRKGGSVILFLREATGKPRYETVDPWFGVQQYNSVMDEFLDEVYAE